MTTAPDFNDGYPSGGERLGPAWQAMWDELADGKWRSTAELHAVAEPWIVLKTVDTLTREARRKRLLESKIVKTDRRRRYWRRPVLVPPPGWNL